MTPVGFEPTSANTVELKSTPLDQLGHSVNVEIHIPFNLCKNKTPRKWRKPQPTDYCGSSHYAYIFIFKSFSKTFVIHKHV